MEEVKLQTLFLIFFIAIMIDFLTGILAAAKEGKLKSRTCSNGMFRSIGECIVLLIFMTVSYLIPVLDFVCNAFITGFICKEGMSIIENLIKLDVWVPSALRNMFEVGIDKTDRLKK